MGKPRLPVDFGNRDPDGAVRLTTHGVDQYLAEHALSLCEGLEVEMTDDELLAEGHVTMRDGMWIAVLERWIEQPPWSCNAGRGAAQAVKVGDYTLTRTVAGKLAERPYLSSPNTLREIMAAGKPIPDPGGVAGALRWDVPGAFNGSAGTWQLVVDPKSNTVLHWLFTSAPWKR
jgi:hypothetical protein